VGQEVLREEIAHARGPGLKQGAPAHLIQERAALSADQNDPILEIREISKAFPGVLALRAVTLSVGRGEVHAVVGENGAGKSTLMKILAGAQAPDHGTVRVGGTGMETFHPETSRRLGIAIIYQEFNLIPHLSAAENISLGREPAGGGWIDTGRLQEIARHWLDELEADIPPEAPVSGLSVASRQLVEVAKALSLNASVLIMDEPASALDPVSTAKIEELIFVLKSQYTIVIVTHNMQQAARVSDQTAFFLQGELIEGGGTARLFTNPSDKRTEDYITGRFG